jgi:hypothetical protein
MESQLHRKSALDKSPFTAHAHAQADAGKPSFRQRLMDRAAEFWHRFEPRSIKGTVSEEINRMENEGGQPSGPSKSK